MTELDLSLLTDRERGEYRTARALDNKPMLRVFDALIAARAENKRLLKRKLNNIGVLHEMIDRDMPADVLSLAPNKNVKRANTGKDGWGEVVIAIPNSVVLRMNGASPPVFNLFIHDQKEFDRVKAELRALLQPKKEGE